MNGFRRSTRENLEVSDYRVKLNELNCAVPGLMRVPMRDA
jgi:hypothetical protein